MEICIISALESRWLHALPALVKIAVGSAVGSVPGTAIVISLNKLFRPHHLEDAYFPMLWLQVTTMAILIAGLALLIGSRITAQKKPSDTIDILDETSNDGPTRTLQTARLRQRLPDAIA